MFLAGYPSNIVVQQLMSRHYLEGLIFSILSLIFFLPSDRGNKKNIVSALCYLLASLEKEIFLPLPLVLLFLSKQKGKNLTAAINEISPHLAMSLAYIPWRIYMLGGVGGYVSNSHHFSYIFTFIADTMYWFYPNNPMGLALFLASIFLAFIGLKGKWISRPIVAVAVLAIVLPLLPIMITKPFPDFGTGYFVPYRYVFLPWWSSCIAMAVLLEKFEIRLPLPVEPIWNHHEQSNSSKTASSAVEAWADGPKKSCEIRHQFGLKRISFLLIVFACLMVLLYQPQKNSCFQNLVAENENLYRTAWHTAREEQYAFPDDNIIAYLNYMISRINIVRGISEGSGLKLSPVAIEDGKKRLPSFPWHYDMDACSLRMTSW